MAKEACPKCLGVQRIVVKGKLVTCPECKGKGHK